MIATDPLQSLTESELRIAELVASGMTNRSIAEYLILSPHTVDTHLKHIYTKLDIHSRVELRCWPCSTVSWFRPDRSIRPVFGVLRQQNVALPIFVAGAGAGVAAAEPGALWRNLTTSPFTGCRQVCAVTA